MSNYRSELLLPVHRDPRSFEQHQKDAFEEMERFLDNSFKSTRLREKTGFKERDREDGWFTDIAKKMDSRRDKWDDEMRKMREEFFQLSPGSAFGDTRGNTFSNSGFSGRFSTDSPSSTFRSGMSGGHSPRSNYSTSTSSTLNSLPSWSGTQSKSSTLGLNQSQSLYQRGADGDMHFQVHFDVADYQPNDIKVIAKDGKLLVTAKQETILPNGSSLKEFNRTVDIPPNLDTSKLTCNLTSDGILVVDSPVECPKYQALPNESNSGCTIVTSVPSLYDSLGYFSTDLTDPYASHGTLDSACGSVGTSSSLSRQSATGAGLTQQSLHFQVPVGSSYSPDEIDIKTQDNKIYIHARHEDKSQNRTSFREFSKEYDIPDNVDPFSVTARLENGILFVEAPFKS